MCRNTTVTIELTGTTIMTTMEQKEETTSIVTSFEGQQKQKVGKGQSEIYPVTEGLQSPQTAAKYKMNFAHFLDYIKIPDLQVLLDLGPKIIGEMIIKYVIYMRDEKKRSRSTINSHCAAILRFMDMNEVDIKPSRIKRHFPPDESTHDDRPYTTGEIQQILSVCDLRNKAIVLLMSSTGMRIGALPLLQIGDISKIEGFNLYKIQVYARTRDRYYTFTTPECSKAIDDYLAYRKRYKEELKEKAPPYSESISVKQILSRSISPDSFLYVH